MMASNCVDKDEIEEPGKVIILSCSRSLPAEEILKGILQYSSLEEKDSSYLEGGVTYYPWKIQNKYYKADILIGYTKENDWTKHETEVLKSASGFIFGFNLNEDDSLKSVESWLPFLEDFQPSLQLLLASEVSSGDVEESRRQKILIWCAEHSFELVERYPAETYDEDDFPEKFSFDRIREALQTQSWPNMVMNDSPVQPKEKRPVENGLTSTNESGEDKTEKTEEEIAKAQFGYHQLVKDMEDAAVDDVEGQSFEELFDKLKEMKDRASSMPENERKNYAEKVVVAFWRALGGDEDEIDGIE